MKHLKIFEELYHQIAEPEWNEAVGFDSGEEFEDFTKREEVEIRKLLRKNVRVDIVTIQLQKKPANALNIDLGDPIINVFSGEGYSITKLKDEWYYVYDKDNFLFYKCDTFEAAAKKDVRFLVD
jgi:rubrerythrin